MKWKHWLRYPLDRRVATKALRRVSVPVEYPHPAIGFDLKQDHLLVDGARHLACLAILADRVSHEVVLRCSPVLLAAIAHKRLGALFLSLPNVSWVAASKPFSNVSVALTDHDETDRRSDPSVRRVRMLIGKEAFAGAKVLPYPMHPKQMLAWNDSFAEHLRETPKAGIFFAGNQKSRYGRSTMRDRFGVLPRLELVATLERHFAERIEPRHSEGNPDRIVLRDSNQHPVAGDQWMKTLAEHRFFLCCPGAAQPMCHNVIESMACGVIPLIEYGDRFEAPLRDGVNAICFEGRDGLVDAVRRIDQLSPLQLNQMSQAAADYYDRHLRGDLVLRNVLNDDSCERLSLPFHESNLFQAGAIISHRLRLAS